VKLTFAALCAVALTAAGLSGCATKNFGTQPALTDFERQNLSCREIDLEKAKVIGFMQQANKENQFDGRDILAAFGDLGIGNSMAHSAAIDSAYRRTYDLELAAYNKGCTTYKPVPLPDPVKYEERS